MIIEIRNYKISPYSGNTCWKIQKRQDKEGSKTEWCEPYYYPSSLDRALEIVYELILRDDGKRLKSMTEALKEMKSLKEEFKEVLSSYEIQPQEVKEIKRKKKK